MADWNAELYKQFEAERTRPAAELLARVKLQNPGQITDLGCGPGNSTELLVKRYPAAAITGIDTSENMLAEARTRLPAQNFTQADIASWVPKTPQDLIYANASLQWVPDHITLLPRLLKTLAPGGILAIQMPDNFDQPTHRLMRETAAAGPWARTIGDAAALRIARLPITSYYDLLAQAGAAADIWRTTYYHPMPAAEAIVTWLRGTGLKPFLEPLTAPQQTDFLAAYTAKIDTAYPPQADGIRLLAFPRMFIVAGAKP
jgi:trans-aconitate 2-methyltransferase